MKEKNTLLEKIEKFGKGNRVIATVLCVCLIMVSLPVQYIGLSVEASRETWGTQQEIVSFSELSGEVGEQTVEHGTPLRELNLPDTLTASCRPAGMGNPSRMTGENADVPAETAAHMEETDRLSQTADVPAKDVPASEPETLILKDEETIPATDAPVIDSEELTSGTEGQVSSSEPESSIVEPETPISESEIPVSEPEEPASEPELPSNTGTGEATETPGSATESIISGITWESAPKYDGGAEGEYVFTPVLPDTYILVEGVALPEITVTVEKSETDGTNTQEMEGNLIDIEAGETKVVMDAGMEQQSGSVAPACGVISEDTTWTAGTLSAGTVTIEEGVTLTIRGCVTIDGEVTIEGGGKILRGSGAYFDVNGGANSLTLQSIMVDGAPYQATTSLMNVTGGIVTLDECTIQNCRKFTYEENYGGRGCGGVISASGSKITIVNSEITDCQTKFDGGVIYMFGSTVDIRGTTITNCRADCGGMIFMSGSTVDIRETEIMNCTAGACGGAIYACDNGRWKGMTVNIYSGTFCNNRTTSIDRVHDLVGGGFMYSCTTELNIYGGNFTGNSAVNKGGCIYHCGHEDTYTNLYGGVFSGNTCSYQDETHDYRGSGAIYNSSVETGKTELTFSGNVKFAGDGVESSGTDGIYLDSQKGMPRKIWISSTLTYPVTLYVKAIKNYVIAEGKDGHVILHNRDMKQISFVNIDKDDKKWYAKLYDDANQVRITDEDPGYKYFVYYVGVDGKVVDDEEYDAGSTAIVKSGKGLQNPIPNEERFLGWSKTEGSKTVDYTGGEEIKDIQDDIRLYAVYVEEGKKALSADFYSGSAGQKETISEEVEETVAGITIKAPELKELKDIEGYTPVGWATGTDQFKKVYGAGDDIELTEELTSFYGVYEKDVTLIYDANGGVRAPEAETGLTYINVNSGLSEKPAEFTAAEGVTHESRTFKEWNTSADESGTRYQKNSPVNIKEDLTLYAIYDEPRMKTLFADFYSGSAGQKETISEEVEETVPSITIKAPQLKELKEIEGYTPVGWATAAGRFETVYDAGEDIELTEEHTSFYGVYQKDVTLTYDANGGIGAPEAETEPAYINVNNIISEQPAGFTLAEGIPQAGLPFKEWNESADETGTSYMAGTNIERKEDLTLYAIYDKARTKTLAADFYSGEAGQKENIALEVNENAAGGAINAPGLEGMEGFTPMGWNAKKNGYDAEFGMGDEVILEKPLSAYYGIYRRPYSLTYDANGGDDAARIVTDYCYANVHDEVTYQLAQFVVGPGVTREGYHFEGWNTRADGGGDTYIEKDKIKVTGNATLYAKWAPDVAEYKVEHYRQETDGSYALVETERLEAYTEDKVSAKAKTYEGFTENILHKERASSGIVKADGGLTLKLYYDRDIYEVAFHLNGAEGSTPETQKLRYGTYLQTVNEPSRRGYTFGGWYLDEEGTAGREWEYGKTVEENFLKAAGTGNDATSTDGSKTRSVTLYAKWVDDIAPVLGDTSFNRGYKNFINWIIRQKDLIIKVPITEEGSGVKQVDYSILPDESAKGNLEASEGTEYAASIGERNTGQQRHAVETQQSAESETGTNGETGTLYIMEGRSSVNRMNDVLSDRAYEDGFGMVQILVEDGQTVAELTIEEDFKGQVVLSCTDRAGNVSTEKMITAEGGMIVEDNAPSIRFSSEDGKLTKTFQEDVTVDVSVRDDVDRKGKGNVAGGIARVSYRIDSGKEKDVSEEEFQEEIVESCGFSVKVSGEGTHTLTVRSSDHAGNESVESIDITIKKNLPAVTPPQENGPVGNMPTGSEPKTGDFMHVEIYATVAMIAGLTYLLLYFMPEERGMTEEQKAELISRLVRWAGNGSRIRKLPAFIGIFFLLLYYHSIGKSVTVEWGEKNAFDNVL